MKVKRLSLAMLTIPMIMYDDEQDDDSDDDDDVVVVERALSHLSAQPILPPLCGTTGGQTTSHNAPNTIAHSALHTIILDCTVHKWYQCNMFLQRVKPVQRVQEIVFWLSAGWQLCRLQLRSGRVGACLE